LKSAVMQVWTQNPRPMLCAHSKHRMLAASNMLRRACSTADDPILSARYYIGTLQTGTFENSILGVFIDSEWTTFGKFGIWARSELGIGHDVRRAFRTGGIWTWGAVGP